MPVIDIVKANKATAGMVSLTPSNQRFDVKQRPSETKMADVRKLKPKRAVTSMSPFAMTFGGDRDIPGEAGRKSRGSTRKKKKKRTNSSD